MYPPCVYVYVYVCVCVCVLCVFQFVVLLVLVSKYLQAQVSSVCSFIESHTFLTATEYNFGVHCGWLCHKRIEHHAARYIVIWL